jgi:hypothetical protein
VFFAKITKKSGVLCKIKCNLWFCAKDSPTTVVMCYFLSYTYSLMNAFWRNGMFSRIGASPTKSLSSSEIRLGAEIQVRERRLKEE